MGKKEFGYVAKPQSTQEKAKTTIGKRKDKKEDPHDVEMLKRTLSRVKLTSSAWTEIKKDFRNGAGKDTICKRYGIKRSYYKYLRKLLMAM